MTERETVQLEPGFVLHQRPYRNTSQLVDCLTERHGLVSLVARGSRRPGAGQRAVLQPFLALRLSWLRRGELGRLIHVEAQSQPRELKGEGLLAGFYLNELLLRLTARGDGNAQIFCCYSQCLAELSALSALSGTARAVRLFELRLLEALGYGLGLDHDVVSGEPIRPDRRYRFEPQRGASAQADSTHGAALYLGRELISLREERLDDEESLTAAKRLLSDALRIYLGDRPLRTRSVFQDIFARGLGS